MAEDARFADGGEAPLRLRALDGDDLQVLSSIVQDAVFPITEMRWDKSLRRFAILLNRFRWEDVPAAKRRGRSFERVQSVLVIEDVLKARTQGIDRNDKDMILSLLAIEFAPGDDGMGRLDLTLAGDGAVALDVEALEVTLKDVTRPYVAPSKSQPTHPE
jgi:hypothetical protein